MMKTLLLSEEQTEQAAEIIKRGGLVAMMCIRPEN